MSNVTEPELFEGTAANHLGQIVWRSKTGALSAVIAEAEKLDDVYNVVVRGTFTTDGTRWRPGGGRVVAQRERGQWVRG